MKLIIRIAVIAVVVVITGLLQPGEAVLQQDVCMYIYIYIYLHIYIYNYMYICILCII